MKQLTAFHKPKNKKTGNESKHCQHTRLQDAVDEFLACNLAIVVAVLFAEEIHDTRLVVVHPAHVAMSPFVKVKVLHAFNLLVTFTHRLLCTYFTQ